jgi:hypothetical protein
VIEQYLGLAGLKSPLPVNDGDIKRERFCDTVIGRSGRTKPIVLVQNITKVVKVSGVISQPQGLVLGLKIAVGLMFLNPISIGAK